MVGLKYVAPSCNVSFNIVKLKSDYGRIEINFENKDFVNVFHVKIRLW